MGGVFYCFKQKTPKTNGVNDGLHYYIYLAPCFQRFPCHSTDYTRLQILPRNGSILRFLSFLCYCVFITDCLHCDFFQEARKAQLENHEPEDEEEDMDKETQDSG